MFIAKLMLITARSYTTTQHLHSSKFTLVDKVVVRMRTRSLVPKPKTTVIGLGARLAHVKSR